MTQTRKNSEEAKSLTAQEALLQHFKVLETQKDKNEKEIPDGGPEVLRGV